MSEYPPNPEQSGPGVSGSLAQLGSADRLSIKPIVDHDMAPSDGGSPCASPSSAIISPASMVQPICETSRVLGVTNIDYQVFVPSYSKPKNDSKVPSRTFHGDETSTILAEPGFASQFLHPVKTSNCMWKS